MNSELIAWPSLTAPETALAALLALLPAELATRSLAAPDGVGRVLAETLAATRPVPAAAVASQDGWAVRAADTDGAGPYAPMPLPGEPAWVAAGVLLPPGTDAVLPAFDACRGVRCMEALQPVSAGDGVRQPGEDLAGGAVIRAAGEMLSPLDLPALAACGIASVLVRIPRITWLGVADKEGPGQGSSRGLAVMFAALLAAEGADFRIAAPVPGDAAAIAGALRAAASDSDLVLLPGADGEAAARIAAAGLTDARLTDARLADPRLADPRLADPRLADVGQLSLHGIGARPGSMTGFGSVGRTPVLLFPGRAEDAVAAWLLLGRPSVRRMTRLRSGPPCRARLTGKVASTVGLAELVAVRMPEPGLAEPLAVGTLPLGILAAADAILVVPPGSEGFESGALVDLLRL